MTDKRPHQLNLRSKPDVLVPPYDLPSRKSCYCLGYPGKNLDFWSFVRDDGPKLLEVFHFFYRLWSHRSRISGVTQGILFWRCLPKSLAVVSVTALLKWVTMESRSASSSTSIARGANLPTIVAWKALITVGAFSFSRSNLILGWIGFLEFLWRVTLVHCNCSKRRRSSMETFCLNSYSHYRNHTIFVCVMKTLLDQMYRVCPIKVAVYHSFRPF